MANVAVVGSQWGDEGKGKIVDWLSERADVVVRFQGGHNAGHTLVIDGRTYKLSLLPSGVVRPGKLSVIGSGVVVDPWALLDEIDEVPRAGVEVSPETFRVAENACLILPLHPLLDHAREAARGSARIGTTGRGIGPAYEDKAGRRAIRLCDLADPDGLAPRVDFHLYPLSFGEYLGLGTSGAADADRAPALIDAFERYLMHGGFLTAINDLEAHGRILPATFAVYGDWIRGDMLKRGKQERYLSAILGERR